MREFSWRYFMLTGDIEAYLLYRTEARMNRDTTETEEEEAEEAPASTD